VHKKLVTPVGLWVPWRRASTITNRGISATCAARDAAYHQASMGLADRSVHRRLAQGLPDDRVAAWHFLDGFEPHLAEAGIGSISEVFDAEPPFTRRGCIAQAWSVAEVPRCLIKTAPVQRFCL
jgi:hypothetical protein